MPTVQYILASRFRCMLSALSFRSNEWSSPNSMLERAARGVLKLLGDAPKHIGAGGGARYNDNDVWIAFQNMGNVFCNLIIQRNKVIANACRMFFHELSSALNNALLSS